MTKQEKLDIIKWYISNFCGFYDAASVQTEDLKQLEALIRNDRLHSYNSTCSSCYWGHYDYPAKCKKCIYAVQGTHEIDGYTFPYAFWRKMRGRLTSPPV